MREPIPYIYIFSVYQKGWVEFVNRANHRKTLELLEEKQIPHKEVAGLYKGDFEYSILISGKEYKSLIETICARYSQESYLVSDDLRKTWMVGLDTKAKHGIGKLVASIEEPHGDYTFDPITGLYWEVVA